MQVATVGELVELLHRSELLTANQLSEIASLGASDAQTLARRMFRRGWITRWQALTLLQGRWQFTIGRYKLLELIGTGGMGAVFKAIRPDIGRVVAIKVLKPKILKKASGLQRFLREIRSAASLDHPNIVQAYDADDVNNTYVLVMEYVEGRDLRSYISEKSAMPIAWVCECMRQAAQGLQHAAERGTVHRDIKPANLMVTETEGNGMPVVKILDFGLARFASETEEDEGLTRIGQAVGSPDYISPEQAQNSSKADIRADIYSLGCTFFELLTGQVPYPIENLTEKLVARVRSDAPRVRSVRPDVPEEIDAIVATMLARNPADRYQTPAELARALAPFSLTTNPSPDIPIPEDTGSSSDWEIESESPFGRFLDDLNEEAAGDPRPSPSVSAAGVNLRRRNFKQTWPVVAAVVGFVALLVFISSRLIPQSPAAGRDSTKPREVEAGALFENSAERTTAAELLSLGATLLATSTTDAPGAQAWPPAEGARTGRWVVEITNPAQIPKNIREIVGVEFRVSPQVTDVTVERLSKLPGIEQLTLDSCRVTDLGLEHLSNMRRLRVLSLSDMAISDVGLQHLKTLERLEELSLNRTPITGEGLSHLSGLTRIRRLSLEFTRLSGQALQFLGPFKNLESLSLDGDSKIPAAALTHLESLSSLTELSLRFTNLTEQSVAKLKRSSPKLNVRL